MPRPGANALHGIETQAFKPIRGLLRSGASQRTNFASPGMLLPGADSGMEEAHCPAIVDLGMRCTALDAAFAATMKHPQNMLYSIALAWLLHVHNGGKAFSTSFPKIQTCSRGTLHLVHAHRRQFLMPGLHTT